MAKRTVCQYDGHGDHTVDDDGMCSRGYGPEVAAPLLGRGGDWTATAWRFYTREDAWAFVERHALYPAHAVFDRRRDGRHWRLDLWR